jgi:hypothetical protein
MADGPKTFMGKLLAGAGNTMTSGLFGLASNLLSNRGAKNRQRLADQQNVKFWNMQNEYNTPANQMKRLQDAGLNPNLIYGSGSANTGIAGGVAPSKPAPYNIKNPVPLQAMLLDAQIKNIQADTRVKNEDALRMSGETPGRKSSIDSKATIDSIKAKGFKQHEAKMIESTLATARSAIANADQAEFNRALKNGEKKAQEYGFYKGQYQATFIEGVLGLPLKDLDKKIVVPPIPGFYDGGTTTMRTLGMLLYGAFQTGKLLINNIPGISKILKNLN